VSGLPFEEDEGEGDIRALRLAEELGGLGAQLEEQSGGLSVGAEFLIEAED